MRVRVRVRFRVRVRARGRARVRVSAALDPMLDAQVEPVVALAEVPREHQVHEEAALQRQG